MDADRSALTSARPVFAVAGTDEPRLAAGLMRLVVHEDVEGLASCEAEFGNWGQALGGQAGVGYLLFDRALLDFGKEVVVRIGSDTVFEGRISALEGRYPDLAPPTLVMRAEDRLQDLRMTRRTRSFESLSDADLVQRIASDHGLQAQVDWPGSAWPLLVQANESDLAFLRRRARQGDADLWIRGRTLHAVARASRAGPATRLLLGSTLRSLQVGADLAHQRTALTCSGWDVAGKQAVAAEAAGSVIDSEAQGGDSGPAVLQQAFGARKDTLAHRMPFDEAAARAEAESLLRTLARRFVRGQGEAYADARLVPGTRVDLQGLGPMFSGEHGLTAVTHRFDQSHGLRTAFTFERAWIAKP